MESTIEMNVAYLNLHTIIQFFKNFLMGPRQEITTSPRG